MESSTGNLESRNEFEGEVRSMDIASAPPDGGEDVDGVVVSITDPPVGNEVQGADQGASEGAEDVANAVAVNPFSVKSADTIRVRRPLIPMSLRNKIITGFLCPLICGVAVMAISTTVLVFVFAPTFVSTTKDAMYNAEMRALDRTAHENGILVNNSIHHIRTDLGLARDFVQRAVDGALSLNSYNDTSYDCGLCGPVGTASDPSCVRPPYGDTSANRKSKYASTHYDAEYSFSNPLDAKGADLVQKSVIYDTVLRPLYLSNDYPNVYFGFEHRGLYRTYPYKDCRDYYAMSSPYYCDSKSVYTSVYDPRCRIWYYRAVQAGGDVALTEPYLDATTGILLLTAAQSIYNGSELFGVLGIDFSIASIQNAIQSAQVLENGYAYVIDENGYAILHPNINVDIDKQDICGLEFHGDPCDGSFAPILARMKAGETGTGDYKKDGKKWFVSYTFVEEAKFSLAVAVPEDDVYKPSKKVTTSIYVALGVQSFIFFVLVCFISDALLVAIVFLARHLVRPINRLTILIDKIIEGDFPEQIPSVDTGSRELTELYDTFKGLMTALKFGNRNFIGGDLKKAMHAYQDALKLFEMLKNEKGQAICLNNIGNVYVCVQEFDNAKTFFSRSIDIGERLVAKLAERENTLEGSATEMGPVVDGKVVKRASSLSDKERRELSRLRSGLSSRLNNLAMVYYSEGNFEQAIRFLDQSLNLDRSTRNAVAFASHVGNLGKIFMKQEKFGEARESFKEALTMSEDVQDEIAKEFALLNMGGFERSSWNFEAALYYFQLALTTGERLDNSVHVECLRQMQGLYNQLGERSVAARVKALSEGLQTGPARHFAFLLDISTSMTGARLSRSVLNLKKVFTDHVYDRDSCSLTTFNHRVQQIFPMQPVGTRRSTLAMLISSIRTAQGGTAFFNAIDHAYNEVEQEIASNQSDEFWIVALTDGNDQHSPQFAPFATAEGTSLRARKHFTSVGLIIVSVGLLSTEPLLRSLCGNTARGRFIRCDDSLGEEEIDKAFEEVASQFLAGKLDLQDF